MSYHPAPAVVMAHNIPHFYVDTSANTVVLTSNDFSASRDYAMSIFFLPLLILVFVAFCLFVYHFIFCCIKCQCCKCCACVDHVADDDKITPERAGKIARGRRLSLFFVVFFMVGIIVCDFMFFYGNGELTKGVNRTNDGLGSLQNTTQYIIDTGNSMVDHGNDVIANLDAAETSCSGASSIDGDVQSMIDSVNQILGTVDSVPDQIQKARDKLEEYGVKKKNEYAFTAYFVILGFAVIYALGVAFHWKTYLRVVIALTGILILLLTLLCCVEMILLTAIGDVCMNPTRALVDNLGSSSDFGQMASYYTTCIGTDPIGDYEDDIDTYLTDVKDAINNLLGGPCPGNSDLIDALDNVDLLQSDLHNIEDVATCATTSVVWDNLVNSGFCNHTFTGFFAIWMSVFVIAGCLFFLNFSTGILFQYFDDVMWNIGSSGFDLDAYNADDEGNIELRVVPDQVRTSSVEYEDVNGDAMEEYEKEYDV